MGRRGDTLPPCCKQPLTCRTVPFLLRHGSDPRRLASIGSTRSDPFTAKTLSIIWRLFISLTDSRTQRAGGPAECAAQRLLSCFASRSRPAGRQRPKFWISSGTGGKSHRVPATAPGAVSIFSRPMGGSPSGPATDGRARSPCVSRTTWPQQAVTAHGRKAPADPMVVSRFRSNSRSSKAGFICRWWCRGRAAGHHASRPPTSAARC